MARVMTDRAAKIGAAKIGRAANNSGASRVLGWIVSAAVAAVLLADGLTGLLQPDTLAEAMRETGFPLAMLPVVGWAALLAAIVYAVPRTAVLGAILVTGFCGGAIAIHVRIGTTAAPPQIACLAVAVATWAGLWLRDPRVRRLLPLR